jgi:mono/diheme cytochrome c family protein
MRYLLVALLIGCSGNSKTKETSAASTAVGDPVRGATIYKTHCSVCHQIDGSGRSPQGIVLGGNFSADKSVLAKTDEALLNTIKMGKTGSVGTMPPWGGVLDQKKRRDVLAYIRATFGKGK